MKTGKNFPNSATPPVSVQAASSTQQGAAKAIDESPGLSPARVEDGVTAKTEVLEEILERAERSSRLMHWGINE